MATLPTVAIIGRPNTGKSTLFNRLIGRRQAIVSDVPGTTRDHVAGKIETDDMDFLLVDTGGMGGGTEDKDFEDDVEAQSKLAIEHADLILFTVDSREPLTRSDFTIVATLRKKKKKHVPVIIVVTKGDNPENVEGTLAEYHELAIADEIILTSAAHGIGTDELRDLVIHKLNELHFEKHVRVDMDIPRIALIGKPNVGKSSIINAFMSDPQREKSPLLVSEIPGTTRDSIDVSIRREEKEFTFIDTAGIKNRTSTEEGIETHAYFRSIRALTESDIAVLVLDGTEAVSRQDKRIAGLAVREGKGLIILVNKIDLLTVEQKQERLLDIQRQLPFCKFAPIIACSATTREGLLKIFDVISVVHASRTRRLNTKDLHRWYGDAVYGQPMGELSRSKHITQAEDIPPTFVLFVKDPKKVRVSQLRYLENNLRKTFEFEGSPIRWITKIG
jgi:GTP-binding protein